MLLWIYLQFLFFSVLDAFKPAANAAYKSGLNALNSPGIYLIEICARAH